MLKLDYNNMMYESLGAQGITQNDIDNLLPKIDTATATMTIKLEEGKMDWRNLPFNQEDIVKDILAYVEEMKTEIDAFVVLGIGGSALGPMAVQQAINHPYYNELSKEDRKGFPKLYVVDNVDPERLVYLFNILDMKKTLFNVISKSGSTSETMSQFMIIKERLEKQLGKNAKNHIVCTTDKEKGNLITIAKNEGYKTFIIPSGVGGRFSELSPVGLLPAAFCGIDIQALLDGAAEMEKICREKTFKNNSAYMYAVLHYIGMHRGKNISVMMPYADSLKYISDWYAQLWAESLGKKYDIHGKVVNVGQTPVKALGATDQHSQVQLYTEGPFDKIIVLMGVEEYRETITIPKIYGDMPSLGFLGGVTHNQLIQTEQVATEYALTVAGKMNMTITLPHVNPKTLGFLLHFFEIATAFAGELMEIDAFDQPGVEEGKNATYALFGRPGYEEKKKELDTRTPKEEKYII
ncbi:MAG: glucose-6-phosphate isomerase [Defluviitaleaceae bacterium]|nr:glucose-6-phosphate isomerase [Defluviitaleaceae bacterium]